MMNTKSRSLFGRGRQLKSELRTVQTQRQQIKRPRRRWKCAFAQRLEAVHQGQPGLEHQADVLGKLLFIKGESRAHGNITARTDRA